MDEQSLGKAVGAYVEGVRAELAHLTSENERLLRVVEQALDCGGFGICTITEENKGNFYNGWRNVGREVIIGVGSTETFIAGDEQGSPDLYAHLKREDGKCSDCGEPSKLDRFGKCDACVASFGDATYGG